MEGRMFESRGQSSRTAGGKKLLEEIIETLRSSGDPVLSLERLIRDPKLFKEVKLLTNFI